MKLSTPKVIGQNLRAQWAAEEKLYKDWLQQRCSFQPSDAFFNDCEHASPSDKREELFRPSSLLQQVESFYRWLENKNLTIDNDKPSIMEKIDWHSTFSLRAAAPAHSTIPWYAIDMALTASVHIVITPAHRFASDEVDIHLRPVAGATVGFLEEFSSHNGRPLTLSIKENGLPLIVSEGCVHPSGHYVECEGYLLDSHQPTSSNLHLSITYTN